jgi:hypothetical protein
MGEIMSQTGTWLERAMDYLWKYKSLPQRFQQ